MLIKITLRHPDRVADDNEIANTTTVSTFYVHSENLPATTTEFAPKSIPHLVLYKSPGRPVLDGNDVYVALFVNVGTHGTNTLDTSWPLLHARGFITHKRCRCAKEHRYRDSNDKCQKLPEGYKVVRILSRAFVAQYESEPDNQLIALKNCEVCEGTAYELKDALK